jgi:hypothetical protein
MADASAQPDIAFLACLSGLPDLPPEYFPQLAGAYANVRQMVSRLPSDWPRGAEPAHVFVPTTFLPGEE